MDKFVKQKAAVLLAVGQREEAIALLMESFQADRDGAEKLLLALEAESSLPAFTVPDRKKLFHYAGVALSVLGMIVLAVGLAGYFSFSTPEQEWVRTTGVVSQLELRADRNIGMTLTYTYKNRPYSITDVSALWTEFDLHKGQLLDLLVNPETPEDVRLLITKPYLQKSSKSTAIAGVVLLGIAIVMWRLRK